MYLASLPNQTENNYELPIVFVVGLHSTLHPSPAREKIQIVFLVGLECTPPSPGWWSSFHPAMGASYYKNQVKLRLSASPRLVVQISLFALYLTWSQRSPVFLFKQNLSVVPVAPIFCLVESHKWY